MPPKKVPCPKCGDPMSRRSEVCRKCYLETMAEFWENDRIRTAYHCARRRDVPRDSLSYGLDVCEECGFTPAPGDNPGPPYYGVPQTHRSYIHTDPLCSNCCTDRAMA